MTAKVSIIGAGRVGATTAHLIAVKGLADVSIVNRTAGIAEGVALDISESLPLEGSDSRVKGSGDYSDISGSDVVVVTAGAQRKEGMSRDDLLRTNAGIVSGIADQIREKAPGSIVIAVTNPLDAMAYLVKERTGFDRKRVVGMAGALDSARLCYMIADELHISPRLVSTMMLGSHGDSMVPVMSATTANGKTVSGLIGDKRLKEMIERARNGGAEIISLEESSAYYAPASSIVSMVDAILNDKKKIMPCSVYLDGEYGARGIFMGVPAVLGKGGVERIVEMDLSEQEKAALSASASKIAETISQLGNAGI